MIHVCPLELSMLAVLLLGGIGGPISLLMFTASLVWQRWKKRLNAIASGYIPMSKQSYGSE